MYSRIADISTAEFSGETFTIVDVEFWPSEAASRRKPPTLTNTFLMQLRSTGRRVVRDASGRFRKTDGSYISLAELQQLSDLERATIQFATEVFNIDVCGQIDANIRRFAGRAAKRGERGDKRLQRINRGKKDPHGILARADVAAMKGRRKDTRLDRG